MIGSASTGMSLNRMNFATSDTVGNTKKMFVSLSVAMGGDGSSISKSQLSEYIRKVERGQIKLSRKKLDTLKKIHEHWDTLFDKKESIGLKDFEENIGIFAPLFLDSSVENIEIIGDKIKEIREQKKKEFEELKEKTDADEKGITKDNLKDYLKSLLEENFKKDESDTNSEKDKEAEDENLDEINYITNLIAEFDEITGGSEYMTSLEKSTDFSV